MHYENTPKTIFFLYNVSNGLPSLPFSMTLSHSDPNYLEFSSNYTIPNQFKLQMALYCIESAAHI